MPTEPAAARSWEERALTTIIIRTAEAAAARVGPHTLCRYLIDAMDWFTAHKPVPDEPVERYSFEEWLLERWLREARSEAFLQSVDYQRLRSEWERASNG